MMATLKPAQKRRWHARIARARELQQQHPAAAALLRFYENVLKFQASAASSHKRGNDSEAPLRDRLDIETAIASFPDLLAIAANCGPEPLAEKARILQDQGAPEWREILKSAVAGRDGA